MSDIDAEIDVLARTIWGEARGEGVPGMIAVAHVIMNRVKIGGWWGSTVDEVCKKAYQFSCWNANDPNSEKLLAVDQSDDQFALSLQIASAVVDPTHCATHYHTSSIQPDWSDPDKVTAIIGRHIFYKGID